MELWFWRGATAVAVLGWVSTWWAALEMPPAPYVVEPVVREVAARPVVRVVQRDVPVTAASIAAPASVEAIEARVRAEVVAELEEEERTRRERRHAERFEEMLDRVAAFAEAEDLTITEEEALERAVRAMHERMRALGPLERGGPPDPAHREAMHASFQQMDQDIRAALGDPLADAFHESMRPPGGPPPPPPL
ncbi:MAG: hypothetical protein H6736_23090 [Alphaproteobacteria bacterium]|nr:hypothetical protein [Alphaproteobacteria bacterium]MCB9672780.1 hypothetical protein [Alphaproteobacteria bacterium]MCB9694708.1 hypothetical protein [Alphaproteobacteria bacterium]